MGILNPFNNYIKRLCFPILIQSSRLSTFQPTFDFRSSLHPSSSNLHPNNTTTTSPSWPATKTWTTPRASLPLPNSSPAVPPRPSPPSPPIESNVADSFVFAFDIDGVLVRGGKPIPEAIRAMQVLNGDNEYGMNIPHIFLTNGGGKTEEERCRDL